MKKLRISIIDLIHNKPSRSLYRRYMFSNYASIMPQVIGVWCRDAGHQVHYSIYTGTQKIKKFFIDKKVPRNERIRCPILLCREKIIWVAGYRIDESVKVKPTTKNVLYVELSLA